MSLEATPPVILREIITYLDIHDMVNLVMAFPSLNPDLSAEKTDADNIDADWLDNISLTLTRTETDMQQVEIDETFVHLNEPIAENADLFSIVDYSTTVGADKGAVEVELDAPCINMYAKGDTLGWRLNMQELRAAPKSKTTRMQSEIRYNLSGKGADRDSQGKKIHRFWSYDKAGEKIDWSFSFQGDEYCEYKLTDDRNEFFYGIIKNEEGVFAVQVKQGDQGKPHSHVLLSRDTEENAIIKLVGNKHPLVIKSGEDESNSLYYVDFTKQQLHHIADISLEFFQTDEFLLNIPCLSRDLESEGEDSELFISLDGCILRLLVSRDSTSLIRKYDTPQFNQGELALDSTQRFLFSWTPERQAVLDLDTDRLVIILPSHRYESRFVGVISNRVHVWRFNWGYIKDVFNHKGEGKEEYGFEGVKRD